MQIVSINSMINNIQNNITENNIVVDVRTIEECKKTGLVDLGDVNIFVNTIVNPPKTSIEENFLSNLELHVNKNSSVYFMCQSGKRSEMASEIAYKNGYKSYNVLGGYLRWLCMKKPVVDYNA